MKPKKRIGILTAGGDCPGLNAVIRAVSKRVIFQCDMDVIGIEDGYEGLIKNRYRKLESRDVSGILTLGGTILGTSNIANPYRQAFHIDGKVVIKDVSKETLENIKALELEALVVIGGDGSMSIANKLAMDGVNVVGVPKTIDNDLKGTDISFGFDTAVSIVTEGIDRLHTTAQSHHRVMVLEVMGRKAGWIALYAGLAGGGDIILIPEIPYDLDSVIKKVRDRGRVGKRFSIIVVSEGAKPVGGDVVVRKMLEESTDPVRLGGIGFKLADEIQNLSGIECRAVVMGHLQRGGSPTAADRLLATKLGTRVVDLILNKEFGNMIGVQDSKIVNIPLQNVAQGPRLVPPDHILIASGRSIGICFGD